MASAIRIAFCLPPLLLLAALNPEAAVSARRISDPSDLCQGKAAAASVGDYLLANDLIKVIIDDVGKRHGFAESGGNIIDAARRDNNVDLLNQVFTYFADSFPRQAVYDSISIVSEGGRQGRAIIRVSGRELQDPNLAVTTEYILEDGRNYLTLITTLKNNGSQAIAAFWVGDVIQWGYTEHFAPGYGTEFSGQTIRADWIAGISDHVSYVYATRSGSIGGPNGTNWSDINVKQVDLPPGGSASYERFLVVGSGDTASATKTAYALRNVAVGRVLGRTREQGSGASVPSARVTALRGGKPFELIRADPSGLFEALLPSGTYLLTATDIGRLPSPPRPVSVVENGQVQFELLLSPQGKISFTIRDKKSDRLIPGKITFQGIGQTPDPYLGPRHSASGALNVVFSHSGSGETVIPPGLYQVTISRGIEYEIYSARIEVKAGETAKLSAALDRVVDTAGYISGDFHLHSDYSYDSSVALRDKIIALVAEGVEFAVATDHNFITDYSQAIKELNLQDQISSSIGDEVTATNYHFNAFPLVLRPELPRHGAVETTGRKPKELFAAIRQDPGDEVIQINHPRSGNIGYFNTFGFDRESAKSDNPDFDWTFDALEVFNGKRVKEALEVLSDWFALLNRGFKYAATGNSDSHHVVGEESGYPRNFVLLGKDDPQQVTEDEIVSAIKNNRIVVSNGPFVKFRINGKDLGSLVKANDRKIELEISVSSPSWVDVAEVTIIGNGRTEARFLVPETSNVTKFERRMTLGSDQDKWYVVVVRGLRPLSPVVPPLATGQVLPLAFTNPIWVDFDGNGRFDPPNER